MTAIRKAGSSPARRWLPGFVGKVGVLSAAVELPAPPARVLVAGVNPRGAPSSGEAQTPSGRPVRRGPGLQVRTMLLAVAGFLTVFGLVGYEGITASQIANRRMLDERVAYAQSAAAHVTEHLDTGTTLLEDVATAIASGGDRSVVDTAVDNAYRRGIFTGGVVVLDPAGRVIQSQPPRPAQAADSSIGPVLAEAHRLGTVVVSDLIAGPARGAPSVVLAAPVVADGQLRGFVVGTVDLAALRPDELVHPILLGRTGYSQVVDRNGTVIAHTRPGQQYGPSTHADILVPLVELGQPSVAVYTVRERGDRTEQQVIAYAPIASTNWGVTVEQPADEAFAAVTEFRNRMLGIGLFALVATLAVTWAITQRALGPILALRRSAGQMAGGNLDDPVPANGPEEIGDLGRDLDEMRRNLRTSRAEIERLYQKSVADNERLRKLDETKTRLMATVSHDYRNPLTIISTLAELMLLRTYDEAARRQYLELIHGEASRLSELVSDVLELSRAQSGDACLLQEPVDLDEVMAYCLGAFRSELEQGTHHDFVVMSEPELPAVRGDRDRLVQVVMNLVGNAVKYSPHGGRVVVALRRHGVTEILLSIADEGIGIPPEAMPRLFEPFFRVKDESTKGIGGTGLGLVICRHIVEAHGGLIWAESELGKGSTFYVVLPAMRPPEVLQL